ncbi:hypothetical protein IW148_005976 [Coemansia sp. RSA 1199]|nr:hypothetical protein IW148_005976 [Coemansia sp. RSA 1199]
MLSALDTDWASALEHDAELAQLLDHVDMGDHCNSLAHALERIKGPASATALADELPQPPGAYILRSNHASLPLPQSLHSVNYTLHSGAITTITEADEDDMNALQSTSLSDNRLGAWYSDSDLGSDDDLAVERPPSALFHIDTESTLRTPQRRNTVGASQTHAGNRVGASRTHEGSTAYVSQTHEDSTVYASQSRENSTASSLLEDEMPPQSPLFATMPPRAIVEYNESVQLLRKSRRNTMTSGLIEDEMPPASPFFAEMPTQAIDEYHESIRRLRNSRRNTLGAQRATWCAPSTEAAFASTSKPSTTLPRSSLTGMLTMWSQNPHWNSFESPSKRRGEIPSLVPTKITPAKINDNDDWIFNQEPPQSPLFAAYHSEQADKRRAQASGLPPDSSALFRALETAANDTTQAHERWFQVDVHSLFASPFSSALEPRVTVREVAQYDNASSPLVAVDADDPDVLSSLERYMSLLSLKNNTVDSAGSVKKHSRSRSTKLRIPSCSKMPPDIIDFHTPALSFMVRSKSSSQGASVVPDRQVRAVDLEAMVEAYLPHVYAELDAPGTRPARATTLPNDTAFTRSPSESSVATLAEPPSALQPILSAQTPKRMSVPALRKTTSNDVQTLRLDSLASTPVSRGLRQPRPLRASVSVMNLRSTGSAADRLGISRPETDSRTPRVSLQSVNVRKLTPILLPRRRSEALTSPVRDLGSGPPQANRPRPLRASFSQQSSVTAGSRLASPRTSMLSVSSSRTSITTTDNAPESLVQRRWSSKAVGQHTSSITPALNSTSRNLGSLRNRKDMAPLTLAPVRRSSQITDHASYASGSLSSTSSSYRAPSSVLRPARTTSSVTGNRTPVSQGPPPSSAINRRRGISTGSQTPSYSKPASSNTSEYLNRFALANPPPVSRPQVSGRRPDIRQVFAQNSDVRQQRRTTIAHQPPIERSAVRQRIGAKLSEFRSKLFSP